MIKRETISNIAAVCREIGDVSGRAILDIGCGTGELCRALAELGANITGIDPGENAIAQAIELGGARSTGRRCPATRADFGQSRQQCREVYRVR